MIRTYGCSFTKHDWQCWPQFLKISTLGPVENYGVGGAANEFIASRIRETAKPNDTIIVMWSGFDRVHNKMYYEQHGCCEGKYLADHYSSQELWNKTIDEISLTHNWCISNNIKIYNLSAFIFNMGETKILNDFSERVDIGWRDWPISLLAYCHDNPVLGKIIEDTHPSPSQAYKYCRDIIGPHVGIDVRQIDDATLIDLDNNRG